jgi:hypothetical protein
MKLNVLGVKRIHGTSSKSGNDFDMCNVFGIVPVQTGGGKSTKVEGYGLEVAELPLDPACMDQFKQWEGKYPLQLDLETDSRPYMGKLETFVIGVKEVAKVRAA